MVLHLRSVTPKTENKTKREGLQRWVSVYDETCRLWILKSSRMAESQCILFQISVWTRPKWRRASRRPQSSRKRWDIIHSDISPFCWPPQSGKFLLARSCQTGYWFFMLWSMPGCDATWSLSALQQSMAVLRYTCMRTARGQSCIMCRHFWCTSVCVFEGRSPHLNAAVNVNQQTRLLLFFFNLCCLPINCHCKNHVYCLVRWLWTVKWALATRCEVSRASSLLTDNSLMTKTKTKLSQAQISSCNKIDTIINRCFCPCYTKLLFFASLSIL